MAKHTKRIDIIKSSNSYFEDCNGIGSKLGSTIYTFKHGFRLRQNVYIGMVWNTDNIPKNKTINKIDLHFYQENYSNNSIIYQKKEFEEGSNSISGNFIADEGTANISNGWNILSMPGDNKYGSIVMIVAQRYEWDQCYEFYDNVSEITSNRGTSSRRPYVIVHYSDLPPDNPTSLYPSGAILNPRDKIRFSWYHSSNEEQIQKGFELHYKIDDGSWKIIKETTSNQYYELPPDTLPSSGTVLWKVKTIDGNGESSDFTIANFTLGILPQEAPIPISPIGRFVDEKEDILFEWGFVGGNTGEYQKAFELKYSTDNGKSWTTKKVTTEETAYLIESGIINTGSVIWKVKTWNNWDEASPYSDEVKFTIIGNPATPLIENITNESRPTISWISQDQSLFEIEIIQREKIVFKSGLIPSVYLREYKIENYLNDGVYTVKLRISNKFNRFSSWAEKKLTISTNKPPKPILEVFGTGYSNSIRYVANTDVVAVYKDNIFIGYGKNGLFEDFTTNNQKTHEYFIRAIDSKDNFNDSDKKEGKSRFRGNTLSTLKNPSDFIILDVSLRNQPKKSKNINLISSVNYYDGREFPVVNYSEHKEEGKSLEFFISSKEEVDKIIDLINSKEKLLYRDVDGENIVGNIFALNIENNDFGYNISMNILRTGELSYD